MTKNDCDQAREKLLAFLDLPADWNACGARPIEVDAVNAALGLLDNELKFKDVRAAPLPSGGVKLMWCDFELEVDPTGKRLELLWGDTRCTYLWCGGWLGALSETANRLS